MDTQESIHDCRIYPNIPDFKNTHDPSVFLHEVWDAKHLTEGGISTLSSVTNVVVLSIVLVVCRCLLTFLHSFLATYLPTSGKSWDTVSTLYMCLHHPPFQGKITTVTGLLPVIHPFGNSAYSPKLAKGGRKGFFPQALA